ncbi:MAG: outer membrane protein assembly factor BamA [Elusimicrobia bacterium RIFOXYB2_FULL_49_7]|nr:MAG: outer membrane protein assembly factor BamA [Elusimicrobia bacterium RIFOXYB2_FULL_49_7]
MKNVQILLMTLLALYTFSPAQDLSRKIVRKIWVQGDRNVNKGLVTANFSLKSGLPFSEKDVQESFRSLYSLGLFADLSLGAEEVGSDSIDLIIHIKEHPILDHIEFSGNDEFDNKDIEEKINLMSGTVIPPNLIQKAKNQILEMYQEKGYLLVGVETRTYESKEGGKTILEFKINEGKKIKIKTITITGVTAFKEKTVKGAMEDTKEDRWWRSGDYNEDKLYGDLKRIEEFYHNEGFLDARVLKHELSYSDDRKNMFINIDLFEGSRFFVGNLVVSGNELFDDNVILKSCTVKRGDLFSKQQFDLSRYNIESLYREEGYLYVQLNDEKAYRNDTIDVTFRLKEGLPAYINKVIVNGNIKTWDKVVRREVHLRPGDIYRQSMMMLSQRDIMQLNYFDQATPDIRTNADKSVDLLFDVQEKESGTGQVSAGAGYSARDGIVFNTGLSMPNFAISRPFIEGGGQKIDLQLEYGRYAKRYDLGFTEPYFMDSPTLIGFRGYYSWRDWYYNDVEEKRKGLEIRLGRRLKWPDIYFKVYSTYNISYREYAYYDGTLLENKYYASQGITVRNSGYESALSVQLSRNSTDLPDFPTTGSVVEYNPVIAGYLLGGQYEYIRHRLEARLYLPTFWNFVLIQGMKFGHLSGTNIGQYDNFLAGGVNYEGIIRGYSDRTFGALVEKGNHVGFNLVVYSTELRYPIMDRRLYHSIFADFGNTFSSPSDIDFRELKVGIGTGIKIQVPMLGLIGFDVAWGLNDYPESYDTHGNPFTHQQSTGEKPPYFQFHFRIGNL